LHTFSHGVGIYSMIMIYSQFFTERRIVSVFLSIQDLLPYLLNCFIYTACHRIVVVQGIGHFVRLLNSTTVLLRPFERISDCGASCLKRAVHNCDLHTMRSWLFLCRAHDYWRSIKIVCWNCWVYQIGSL